MTQPCDSAFNDELCSRTPVMVDYLSCLYSRGGDSTSPLDWPVEREFFPSTPSPSPSSSPSPPSHAPRACELASSSTYSPLEPPTKVEMRDGGGMAAQIGTQQQQQQHNSLDVDSRKPGSCGVLSSNPQTKNDKAETVALSGEMSPCDGSIRKASSPLPSSIALDSASLALDLLSLPPSEAAALLQQLLVEAGVAKRPAPSCGDGDGDGDDDGDGRTGFAALRLRSGKPSKRRRPLVGLKNLGNTCFMNACVQCLSHSMPLALYFVQQTAAASAAVVAAAESPSLAGLPAGKAGIPGAGVFAGRGLSATIGGVRSGELASGKAEMRGGAGGEAVAPGTGWQHSRSHHGTEAAATRDLSCRLGISVSGPLSSAYCRGCDDSDERSATAGGDGGGNRATVHFSGPLQATHASSSSFASSLLVACRGGCTKVHAAPARHDGSFGLTVGAASPGNACHVTSLKSGLVFGGSAISSPLSTPVGCGLNGGQSPAVVPANLRLPLPAIPDSLRLRDVGPEGCELRVAPAEGAREKCGEERDMGGGRGGGSGEGEAKEVSRSFGRLVTELWAGEAAGAISPAELLSSVHKHVPHFAGFGQHDSQEFLRSLVDKLDEETRGGNELPKCHSLPDDLDQLPEAEQADVLWRQHCMRYASPIQQIFCGQLQSTIECLSCHHRSHCFDPFLDLSVPIPRRRFFSFRAPSLRDCLSELLAEETLQGDNAYSCSHCKKQSKAVRRLSIVRFPSILVIHIKRVASSMISLFQKDSTFVSCDLQGLDLSKFQSTLSLGNHSTSPGSSPQSPHSSSSSTSGSGSNGSSNSSSSSSPPPPVYDLYAVTNHMGSLSSGHYTAHCRNPADGHWYLFNDSGVAPIPASSVVSSSAYVLFYQLRRSPEGC